MIFVGGLIASVIRRTSTWPLMKPVVRADDKIDIEIGGSVVVGKRLDTRRVLRTVELVSIDCKHN